MNIDFTNCTVNPLKIYGGANGSKIGVIYNNKNYMLKFPPIAKNNHLMSYANSSFSEYIACNIIKTLDVPVQETLLGLYNDKIVVACKDLAINNYVIKDFAFLKNTIVDSLENGYGTDLNEILNTIETQNLIDNKVLKEYFWDMFVIDAFLGNFDRHNGNWGFLINDMKQDVKIAPIYDCGSCLYPQLLDEQMKNILLSQAEIDKRIYTFPNSALKENGVKINYYNFLTTTNNTDCIKSLKKIKSRIDLIQINKIIENTPYISKTYKEFICRMLSERKHKILDKAYNLQKNRENSLER
ncbi:HipA-like C-terminal domain-containing protein [Peptoniphilus asaccharolyticus DSM 20463]|uniref:HipA-like C-terminal domain-containing protein n=1 Tax=Peptoniphilus asaccharolyticus DSM 20463 TaxID=573058 RepID=A0A1W1UCF2_PEPAS|nr:HipA domain-containing protein [Peptoniphilus asaccharolyticus]MBL7576470.1 HipA domain-containing protein [Peptoniphilus asaccharolyticus]SMB78730.1 HipA-like C-terminal domain-containing protein [Peptoniphilus asaccharolyticus DSM 20463]